ncbi:MAG: hypothetical protein ACFFAU_17775 [Candidatus Hodarchaeota archaeon]
MNVKGALSEKEVFSLQEIYSALGHAVRYDIINYLGAFHRPIHYIELVEWLQVKPGSFYFHMKKLKNLVKQDEEKRFYLTPMGLFALNIIKSGENLHHKTSEVIVEKDKEKITPPSRFSVILFGEMIRRLTFNTPYKVFITLLMLIQITLLHLSKLGFIPFYMDGNLYFDLIGCILELIISFLIIWILLELIMRYYSPIKGFSRELLMGIPIAISPLFIYPLFIVLGEWFQIFEFLTFTPTLSIIIIFFLQIMSAVFLVQLLQVIKSVSFERALIPIFIILYGFSLLSFLLSSAGIL